MRTATGARAGRPVALAALTALTFLLAACAGVPTDGPVRSTGAGAVSPEAAPFDFNPPGPRPGAGPAEIVSGFLTALEATPVSTRVAAEFLTERAAAGWRPQRRTLIYSARDVDAEPVSESSTRTSVGVRLSTTFQLDREGRWQGRATGVGDGLELTLVRDQGEWRISTVPDAMVVPLSYFEDHYARYALHYFDPSGKLLVPEPVYLPRGVQAATLLVSHLLDGPRRPDRGVERTYFPPRTRVAVSVPIRSDGVAEVPLTEEALDLEGPDLTRAMAQLVWTLRQLPDVTAIQVTVDGQPLGAPGGGDVLDVDSATAFSPYVSYAENALFTTDGTAIEEIRPFARPPRSTLLELPEGDPGGLLGVSLQATVAAVAGADGLVRVYPASGDGGAVSAENLISAPSTLRPMWDWSRRLWLVDRAGGAGAVRVVLDGAARVLPMRSLPDGEITAAALSRDGTRLALALAPTGGGPARLVTTRVQRSSADGGAPLRLLPAISVATRAPLSRVVDLAWRDGTQVAVLTRTARETSQVEVVSIDGQSESGALVEPVDVLFAEAVSLTSAPGARTLLVSTRARQTFELTLQGRWVEDEALVGVLRPGFVG